ncbi:hypothetical protein JDV09_21350 [Mycobacterium sp. Y57]|uniref:hypothetical protein n=1 Tax=Mycolicibacterium xanthum TaxID=2796469 RepID=UPI001C8658F3|nr:hypothetical protein [Mycolicibacterium xanthum]MBX7434621.1 hypothetical protein [Mycolicibacterium xanthum]
MGIVLGLSLTAGEVAWVVADTTGGTVLDHDALTFDTGTEIAGTAARGAHAIATADGHRVQRVRLTWSPDAADDAVRLRTRLRDMGFGPVEAVPPEHASAASAGHPDGLTTSVVLAYGAALAVVDPSEAITEPVAQRIPPTRPAGRRRSLTGWMGVAAAVAVGVLCLSAGAVPTVAPAATSAEQTAPDPGAGWESVTAPPNPASTQIRKVVPAPSAATRRPAPVPAYYPPAQPAGVTGPVPAAAPVPAGEPHLPDAQPHLPGAGPTAGPVEDPAPAPEAPGPPMTVPVNLFSALP